jgi:hypothetical protein
MQAVTFKRQPRVGIIALLVLVAGAALAFALLSSSAGPAQAKVHHAKHHARHHSRAASDTPGATDPGNLQSGDQTTPDTGGLTSAPGDPSGSTDPGGNVQSGDQTTPDTSGSAPGETTGSGESSGDVPGDLQPPGAGATGQGECAGNCVQ